jgi:hypothetical protein
MVVAGIYMSPASTRSYERVCTRRNSMSNFVAHYISLLGQQRPDGDPTTCKAKLAGPTRPTDGRWKKKIFSFYANGPRTLVARFLPETDRSRNHTSIRTCCKSSLATADQTSGARQWLSRQSPAMAGR